jgi:hypothetical protein
MEGLPAKQEAPAPVVAMLEELARGGGEDDGIDAGALMGQLGITDGQLPSQSAIIHRLIDAASPTARERLLVLFFGELFS